MWESLVSSLLTRYFGKYLRGLESENLRVSLTSGEVTLENVALKTSALDDLLLPITIKSGSVGRLNVTVPWRSLRTEPVVIRLERIFVVVAPTPRSSHDPEAYALKTLNTKRYRLQIAEMMADSSEAENGAGGGGGGGTFLEKMFTAMLNNVQIHVEGVHVVYEDKLTRPSHPFIAGLTLQSLHVQTADEHWSPCFIAEKMSKIYKLIQLEQLAVYWNPDDADSYAPARMAELIFRTGMASHPPLRYIIQPLSCRLQLIHSPLLNEVAVSLEGFDIGVQKAQLRDLFDLFSSFDSYTGFMKYVQFRPVSSAQRLSARQRWHFARDCVLHDIHARRDQWRWENIHLFKQRRLDYISLYVAQRRKQTLSTADAACLAHLERDLPLELLLSYRQLALEYLKKDRQHKQELKEAAKRVEEEEARNSAAQKGRSWWSSLSTMVTGLSQSSADEAIDQLSLEMTEDVWREMYDAIVSEDDSSTSSSPSSSSGAMIPSRTLNCNLEVARASLKLIEGDVPLAHIEGVQFRTDVSYTAMATNLRLSLGSVRLLDEIHNLTLITPPSSVQRDTRMLDLSLQCSPQEVFLSIQGVSPILTLNMDFIRRLTRFFHLKSRHQVRAKALNSATNQQIASLASAANTTLENEKQQIRIEVALQAPNISIPVDSSAPSSPSFEIKADRFCFQSCDQSSAHSDHISVRRYELTMSGVQVQYRSPLIDLPPVSSSSFPALPTPTPDHSAVCSLLQPANLVTVIDFSLLASPDLPKTSYKISLSKVEGSLEASQLAAIIAVLQILAGPPALTPLVSSLVPDLAEETQFRHPSESLPPSSMFVPERYHNAGRYEKFTKPNIRKMHVEFSLPSIHIDLLEDQSPVSCMVVELIQGSFGSARYSMTADLSIQNMYFIDSEEAPGSEFSSLIDSRNQGDAGTALISLSYALISKNSPLYADIDHAIMVKLNSLTINWNRKTLLRFLNWWQAFYDSWRQLQTVVESPSAKAIKDPLPQLPSFLLKMKVSLRCLRVLLIVDAIKMAEIRFDQTNIDYQITSDSVHINRARLQSLTISDLTSTSPWRTLIDCARTSDSSPDEPLINFEMFKFPRAPGIFPGCDIDLDVSLNTVDLTYLRRFLTSLFVFYAELEAVQALIVSAAKSAVSAIASRTEAGSSLPYDRLLRYRVRCLNPRIFLPLDVREAPAVLAELGHITIENSWLPSLDEAIDLSVSGMSLRYASVNVVSSVDLSISAHISPSRTEVDVHVPDFSVLIGPSEMKALHDVVRLNTCDPAQSDFRLKLIDIQARSEGHDPADALNHSDPVPITLVTSVLFDRFEVRYLDLCLLQGSSFSLFSTINPSSSRLAFELKSLDLISLMEGPQSGLHPSQTYQRFDASTGQLWALYQQQEDKSSSFDLHFQQSSLHLIPPTTIPLVMGIWDLVQQNLAALDHWTKFRQFIAYDHKDPPNPFRFTLEIHSPEFVFPKDPLRLNSECALLTGTGCSLTYSSEGGESWSLIFSAQNPEAHRCESPGRLGVCFIEPLTNLKIAYRVRDMLETKLCFHFSRIRATSSIRDYHLISSIHAQWIQALQAPDPAVSDSPATDAVSSVYPEGVATKRETLFHSEGLQLILVDDRIETYTAPLIRAEVGSLRFGATHFWRVFEGQSVPASGPHLRHHDRKKPGATHQDPVRASLQLHFYHQTHHAWEPFLESVEFSLNLSKSFSSTSGTLESQLVVGFDAATNLEISISEQMIIQLSKAYEIARSIDSSVVELAVISSSSPQRAPEQQPLVELSPLIPRARERVSPHLRQSLDGGFMFASTTASTNAADCSAQSSHFISNFTGLALEFWLIPSEGDDGAISLERHLLQPDVKMPIPLPITTAKKYRRQSESRPIGVRVANGSAPDQVATVSIDTSDIVVLPLLGESQPAIIAATSWKDGHQMVEFRSRVLIENRTGVILDVLCSSVVLPPVAIGGAVSVPLLHSESGSLSIRPSGQIDYSWCSKPIRLMSNLHLLESGGAILECPPQTTDQRFTGPFVFRCHIRTGYPDPETATLLILPFAIIENCLPLPLELYVGCETCSFSLSRVESGSSFKVHVLDQTRLTHVQFLLSDLFEYSPYFFINRRDPVRHLHVRENGGRALLVRLDYMKSAHGVIKITIFSKYWFINRTGFPLLLREAGTKHKEVVAGQDPQLLSNFFPLHSPSAWYDTSQKCQPPIIFDFTDPLPDEDDQFVTLQVGSSIKSVQPIPLSETAQQSAFGSGGFRVSIPDSRPAEADQTRMYVFSVSTSPSPARFWRTQMITVSPAYMLVNRLPTPLCYFQKDSALTWWLQPQESVPFHWSTMQSCALLQILIDPSYSASGCFSLDTIRRITLKCMPQTSQLVSLPLYVCVTITIHEGCNFIVFTPEDTETPSYRIENSSPYRILVSQYGNGSVQSIEPSSNSRFAWDQPEDPNGCFLMVDARSTTSPLEVIMEPERINIDVLSSPSRVRLLKHDNCLVYHVDASGPTRVLRISVQSVYESLEDFQMIEAGQRQQTPYVQATLCFRGICVSLCNESPQEIVYISLLDIRCFYSTYNAQNEFKLSLGSCQIDNQLYCTPQPVLFIPSEPPTIDNPFLSLGFTLSTRISTIDYVRDCFLIINPCDLAAETKIAFALEKWSRSIHKTLVGLSADPAGQENIGSHLLPKPPSDEELSFAERIVYIEHMEVDPIITRITFTPISDLPDHVQSHWTRKWSIRAAMALARLDKAPLCLNGIVSNTCFISRSQLIHKTISHFTDFQRHQLLRQLVNAKIDYDGGYGTMFNDLFSGRVIPVVRTPRLKTISIPGAVSKVSDVIGTSVVGSFHANTSYQKERDKMLSQKPTGIGSGLFQGGRALGMGFVHGVTGLIPSSDSSLSVGGIFSGVSGVVTKPIVGIFDFVSKTAEGIRSIGETRSEHFRLRMPRYFGPDGVLHPFNELSAQGQYFLYEVDEGRYNRDWYQWHPPFDLVKGNPAQLLVSNNHVVFFDRATLRSSQRLKLRRITSMELHPHHIVLHFRRANGSLDRMVVGISGEAECTAVYNSIEEQHAQIKMQLKGFPPRHTLFSAQSATPDAPSSSKPSTPARGMPNRPPSLSQIIPSMMGTSSSGPLVQTTSASLPALPALFAIVDIKILFRGRRLGFLGSREQAPAGYTTIDRTITGSSGNLNEGNKGSEIFICYKRQTSIAENPITDICVISFMSGIGTRAEQFLNLCPRGYTPITRTVSGDDADLNRSAGGKTIYLATSQNPNAQPIVEIALLSARRGQQLPPPPPGFIRVDNNTAGAPADLNADTNGNVIYLCYKRKSN